MDKPSRQGTPWTIHDIAREAGVSAKTVSRVVNQERGVAEATRRRVATIIEEVAYFPHTGARSLRTTTRDCIGVTLPAPRTRVPLSPTMLNWLFFELDRVFGSKGDFVVFDLNPYALTNHHDYARGLWEQRYSGLVIAGVLDEDDSVVRRVHDAGVPYLTSCRMDTFPECSSATIDIEEGAYLSADYLLQRGHKRIGMLKPFKSMQPGNARLRGYERACEAHGVAFDENLVRPISLESADVINAVFRLVSDPTVTALIDSSGAEDSASIREGARRAGRILGKDVEVLPWTYSHKATVLNEACAHLWLPLREAMADGFEHLEKWFRNETEGPVQVLYRCILRETPGEDEFRQKQTVFQLIT
ncbi:MAG TPA: LacI family DNA-binding transcriptional regulator [Candidatus Hydrogenedentes bacterium]|jgi:LacI family transcriptional regulator|nr:LacI family DNA-binding transcriptional regulator [Candidatus Hydrogenedentota bacterium]